MRKQNIYAFTFIELVISIAIVVILSALGFSSYSEHLENSRDSQRKSDLSGISSALKLHRTKRGALPNPGNSFNILNNGTIGAIQGKLDDTLILSTIDSIPKDPYTKAPYLYSITKNKQEFQISLTLENNGKNIAILAGDYKSVSKNIMPTIILATINSGDVEVKDGVGAGSTNRTKFIFDNGIHNLPYTFTSPYLPYTDSTSFTGLLNDPNIRFTQNNDYRNCNEILTAGKNMGDGVYQVNNYGLLQDTNCTSSYIPTSCKEIKNSNPSAVNGTYTIMPNGISRSFPAYCDMTIDGGGWTLVAKDGNSYNYTIGHCSFMDAPTSTTKTGNYIYWACDLNQNEILLWTPSGWVTGYSKNGNNCVGDTSKTNNNSCTSLSGPTFELRNKGGCMSSITPISRRFWWVGGDWETSVTKNLSYLSTQLTGVCSDYPRANTSYCHLFDVRDSGNNGIGQRFHNRNPNCTGGGGNGISAESHLILVR